MLIAKGFRVICEMKHGRTVRAPANCALLHDESGRDWPSCSAIVMPIQTSRNDEPVDDRAAHSYFDAQPMGGRGETPPRNLSQWKSCGEIADLLYTRRRPRRLPGQLQDDYYHPIEHGEAWLYRLMPYPGGYRPHIYRIELGSGCKWNWRGIIRP